MAENKQKSKKAEKVIKFIKKCHEASQDRDYIYIIKCHQFYKIGITDSLEKRLDGLQCGNPYPLEIVYSVKFWLNDVLEKALHEGLKNKKIRGEWFLLNDRDLENIKETIKETIIKYGLPS